MDFGNRRYESPDQECAAAAASLTSRRVRGEGGDDGASRRIVPVILSGGAGSRLWPCSTEDSPKQFLSITGAKSLFRLTVERVADRTRFAAPLVMGSLRHAELCEGELSEIEGARLILEPCARNTGAAVAMAAVAARDTHGEDALLLVMPSDHLIEDVAAFHEAVDRGCAAARAGRLVTFGIEPTSAETGFGYLEIGADLVDSTGAKEVVRFVEKPQLDAAEQMVADGRHLWNAGIFLFRVGTFLDEVRLHAETIGLAAEKAIALAKGSGHRIVADLESLETAPSASVDCAVMERSSRLAVIPMSAGWSDLGSWDALAELFETPSSAGPITALDCDDCFIHSDRVQVAALGIRDLIVIASGEQLLILPRGRSHEVKKLLSAMHSMAA